MLLVIIIIIIIKKGPQCKAEREWYIYTPYQPEDPLGRVDDLSFFDYLSPFCFLLIEFHGTFSISYKILPDYVYYYCISIRI